MVDHDILDGPGFNPVPIHRDNLTLRISPEGHGSHRKPKSLVSVDHFCHSSVLSYRTNDQATTVPDSPRPRGDTGISLGL